MRTTRSRQACGCVAMASVGHSRSRCRHSRCRHGSAPLALGPRGQCPRVPRGRVEGYPSRAEGLPVRRGGRLGCCDRGAWDVLTYCRTAWPLSSAHMRCTCGAHAVHMRCTCGVRVQPVHAHGTCCGTDALEEEAELVARVVLQVVRLAELGVLVGHAQREGAPGRRGWRWGGGGVVA